MLKLDDIARRISICLITISSKEMDAFVVFCLKQVLLQKTEDTIRWKQVNTL